MRIIEFTIFNHRDPMIFDAPLSETGIQQAIAAQETVRKLNAKHVIVSPLSRFESYIYYCYFLSFVFFFSTIRTLQTYQLAFENAPEHSLEVNPLFCEFLTESCDIGRFFNFYFFLTMLFSGPVMFFKKNSQLFPSPTLEKTGFTFQMELLIQ